LTGADLNHSCSLHHFLQLGLELNFCHFLSNNHGIAFTDLLSAQSLVIEVTLMFVAVSMNGTEEATTAAGEPGQSNLLLTGQTAVLLLLPVLLAVLVGVLEGAGSPQVLLSVSGRSQDGNSWLGSGQTGCRTGGQDLLFTET